MLIIDKIFEKCRFGSTFAIYFDFSQNCRTISILVNIYENLDFGQSLWKSRFWSKLSENLDLAQHFGKISILVNIFGKIDLGQNFPQIFSQHFQKEFLKIFILFKIDKNLE